MTDKIQIADLGDLIKAAALAISTLEKDIAGGVERALLTTLGN